MKRRGFVASVLVLGVVMSGLVSGAHAEEKAAPKKLRVYIGTYTKKLSKGIYVAELDLANGKLSEPELAAETTNPSFLAIHPNRKSLYAVAEGDGVSGGVAAYAIDPKTGSLTLLGKESSGGNGPCYVAVDPSGKALLVANYGAGSVASLPIKENGALGPAGSTLKHTGKSVLAGRQDAPHAHSINVDAAGRFAFAADLGLDKVLVYKLDAEKATLTPHEPPAANVAGGSGPRHFAFHPSGKFAYLINEMANTVTAFAYDAERGELKELQTITTLPSDFNGKNSTAEVVVHPSGKFVYGSNRGHDSIAMFTVDTATGKLTANGFEPTQGKMPRNFAVDPTGQYLLAENQGSDSIVIFQIEPATGKLKPTGQTVKVGSPVCVKFVVVAE